MKKYSKPQAELILLASEDVVTVSVGEDYGMDIPAAGDEIWGIGEISGA